MSRIVVKVGSSSLTTPDGHIDPERLEGLVDAVAAVRARGDDVVLVSSGAIAAGLGPLGLPERPRDLPTQQAAASVGQSALMAQYSARFACSELTVGQVLLTVDDVTRRSHYRNAHQTFAKLLELGIVPIVNENDTVATSEIRFGDNDRLAALVAHLVQADLLVLLSDVDGLYTAHPSEPGSRLIEQVASEADLAHADIARVGSAVGTGGMVTKVEAARIATAAGIPVVLTSAGRAAAALGGEPVGTRFAPTGKRRPSRLLWLAHASQTKGAVRLDAGAVRALTDRGASLLAAGITGVTGEFSAGDPVDVLGPDGAVVARGLVNFDSDELPGLLGRSTDDIVAELGPDYDRTVVHRDDLMLLGQPAG
ncbi:MAG: glutamate 5-kinase [Aeromicrobium sp.]|uniref:glutamate 5-kinase n=1 Tax=Aeromicrobium sp. TaxID=1871063 RepID=UPI0039E61281